MPYENEFAHYKPLRRIVESTEVQGLLKRMHPRPNFDTSKLSAPKVELADLHPTQWTPDFVLAIDGSESEISVQNGYPSASVGYVTVASVLLDVAKMVKLDAQRPVDPKEFRTIEQTESIDSALPITNMIIDDELDTASSFRRTLYELLKTKQISEGGETLLDTYQALLKDKPEPDRQSCPFEDCLSKDKGYKRGIGQYKCGCSLDRHLFSTDALRIHESIHPEGSNISAITQTVSVLEKLWFIHFLRTLENEKLLPVLQRMAIIIDGPLAVFDDPAWLSTPIRKELQRINEATRKALNDPHFDLLILGIEKTGSFVEHLAELDKGPNDEMDFLPRQTAMLLTDAYIKERIIFSTSERDYGRNTYFGRKVYYKAKSGALLVLTTPFLTENQRDIKRADIDQFPRLADAMSLLDKLVSARFRNSVTPIISAHAEAAIPLNLGKKVLEKLARELMSTTKLQE